MEKGENIRVLVVAPAKVPYERTISTLEEMQEIVGGHIETVHPFADDPVALVVNENGKMLDLPYNRAIMDESGLLPEDMIQGTFFVAGAEAEDFISLTDEQIGRYAALYSSQTILTAEQQPEKLQTNFTNGRSVSITTDSLKFELVYSGNLKFKRNGINCPSNYT